MQFIALAEMVVLGPLELANRPSFEVVQRLFNLRAHVVCVASVCFFDFFASCS